MLDAGFRSAIPWWAKIGGKMALARLPVPMETWHRLGLFVPGFMRDPGYAIGVFHAHWMHAGQPAPGFTYLELGPGGSLATAVVAWAFGATGGTLVDAGDLAVRDIRVYRPLIEMLVRHPQVRDVSDLLGVHSLDALLATVNANVRTDGLSGLRSLPSESASFVFSHAVLEHIPLAEFADTARELHRIQTLRGVGSHRVDFQDHLQGSLHHLRFSDATWEKPWFASGSGFYTNRLRLSEMVRTFRASGFDVDVRERDLWPTPPIAREHLAPRFRAMDDDDLRTSGAVVFLARTA